MERKDWSNEHLLILPFDHRGTFMAKMFDAKGQEPTPEQRAMITECKTIVYDAFKQVLNEHLEKNAAGILCDAEYGEEILKDAKENGIRFALTCEKSGQKEFDFEYGDKFGEAIEKYQPTLAKVLVRYNVEGDLEMNKRQLARLKEMNDYLEHSETDYLFELLVPPTEAQLAEGQEHFDKKLRPGLMVRAIAELHAGGVNPDVWKLEGVDTKEDAQKIVDACHDGGRKAGVIILGRGANKEAVDHWLKTGASVHGTIGFAVGRTIFWDAITKFYKKASTREEAVDEVAEKYLHFVKLWQETKEA